MDLIGDGKQDRFAIANSVRMDLKQVTHLALKYSIWCRYGASPGRLGSDLRKHLNLFPALKLLFIVHDHDEHHDRFDIPKCTVLKDNIPDRNVQLHELAWRDGFLHTDLREKEKRDGVPKVQFVRCGSITHIPGDSRGGDDGEPFVSNLGLPVVPARTTE